MITNEALAAAVAAADENSLSALANKGLYKRALKDAEGQTAQYTEAGDSLLVDCGGEKCIIRSPLDKSSCTCPSRTVCRHILGAVLMLKKEIPEGFVPAPAAEAAAAAEQPEEKPEEAKEPEEPGLLKEKQTAQVRECARQGLKLLGGLLARGLIRADASAADELELAAVSAHAAGMADAERLLRTLCARLTECTERKASFDGAGFTRLLCSCALMLKGLDKPELKGSELGVFRAEYEPYPGTLVLLPIGIREQRGGAFEGKVYYFLNMDEKAAERFLIYSDLRPTYYGGSRTRLPSAAVWGLAEPLRSMMHSRMTLEGAKLCGCRLSGSNSTRVASTSKARLDCPQLRRLIIYDYRELAYRLRDGEERPFLIRIEELAGYGFNKYSQHFGMTVRDAGGRQVGIYVRYRAENKEFIERLEKLCPAVKAERGVWTALVLGRMNEGRVMLTPVELYSFIDAADMHSFEPEVSASPQEAEYAGRLLGVISELENSLVRTVRSGLGSVQEDHTQLLGSLKSTGMLSLAGLAEECFHEAGSYRHHIEAGGEAALLKTAELMRYIAAAKSRLGLITAVENMEVC